MAKNTSLGKAKDAKQDEFYTRLSDIENELRHYREHFKGKTVLCNCDDPYESNFFKYFALNFNKLGLSKLIATCYSGSPITGTQLSLFGDDTEEERRTPYKAVVTTVHDTTGEGGIDMFDIAELFRNGENVIERLNGDGDFRSDECLELLRESDIVVSNPPFSLIREYVALLVKMEKSFVIIGPQNALKYKEIFPLIQANRIWLGYGFNRGDAYFSIPKENARNFASGVYDENTGLVHFRNCTWYTNLDIKKRHEELILVKRYDPSLYPTYANYPAIEVGRTAAIPCDYAGAMGVPITFMEHHNPSQFEIIGYGCGNLGQSIGVGDIPREHKAMMKGHSAAGDLYYLDADGNPKVPYARILVRNLHPEEPR